MNKRIFYTEAAYIFGVFFVAFGTAFMVRADFGVSMVVAPAYLLYLKLSQIFSFFTFGMAEYTLQAVLLIILGLVIRKFKVSFLFSFATAVIYGFMLDGCTLIANLISTDMFLTRIIIYIVGYLFCAMGISLVFHTYIPPEAYELFVKEVSSEYGININKFKTIYDCSSCIIGIIMSFAFFGMWHFEGIKAGTVIIALINGWVIGKFTKVFEKFWIFKDGLKILKFN